MILICLYVFSTNQHRFSDVCQIWRLAHNRTGCGDGNQTAQKHTMLLLDIYRDGVKKDNLDWSEIEIQKRLLGKYMKNA